MRKKYIAPKFELTETDAKKLVRIAHGSCVITPKFFTNGHVAIPRALAEFMPSDVTPEYLKRKFSAKHARVMEHDYIDGAPGFRARFTPTEFVCKSKIGVDIAIFEFDGAEKQDKKGNWQEHAPSKQKFPFLLTLNAAYCEILTKIYGAPDFVYCWQGAAQWSATEAILMPIGQSIRLPGQHIINAPLWTDPMTNSFRDEIVKPGKKEAA